MQITVVCDPKTGKIYPHDFGDFGEILITTSGNMAQEVYDRLIVHNVDTRFIDTDNWFILKEISEEWK